MMGLRVTRETRSRRAQVLSKTKTENKDHGTIKANALYPHARPVKKNSSNHTKNSTTPASTNSSLIVR